MTANWTPSTTQNTEALLKAQDLQVAKYSSGFAMTHKMGLIQINMAKTTAPETRTYTANTVTKYYDSGNVEFYALNVFDGTNLPYSASCPGTVSYFIVKYSSGTYSFTTPYKALNNGSTTGAVSQWTMSAVTAPASGECVSSTTGNPVFKNLGRLYSYTGASQTYTPMLTGFKYKMECWGASGGYGSVTSSATRAGRGAYVYGRTEISSPIHIYVGQGNALSSDNSGFWNGGGFKGTEANDGSGGGATDIRLVSSGDEWKTFSSLKSRIIVAAGGGGSDDAGGDITCNPDAGGVEAQNTLYASSSTFTNATQTAGGSYNGGNSGGFGFGNQTAVNALCGGGGGWYGGAGSDWGGLGGTCYVSGHSGCVAIKDTSTESNIQHRTDSDPIQKSLHYSNIKFDPTTIIDGSGYKWSSTKGDLELMPNPATATGTYTSGTGHTGSGYARITCTPYD